MAVVLTGGEVSDVRGYAPVMAEPGPTPKVLLGDKGYDADAILADLEGRGIAAVIPPKRNRKVQPIIDGPPLRPEKSGRTMLLKAQAQPQTGHPLRQNRRRLPRLRPRRLNQAMGQALRQQDLVSAIR